MERWSFCERRSRKVFVERVVVKAESRDLIGKQVKAQRREGKLPIVLYGRHLAPTTAWVDAHNANMVLDHLTQSALVTIELGGESHLALIREKQRNYLTGKLLHIDFLVVSATEKLRANVPIEFIGVSPAVKNYSGIVFDNLDELEVEALPNDLPEKIVVDISGLATIGAAFHVKDLVLPGDVRILDDPNEIIVVITAPEAEEKEVTEAASAEPEVIEKKKKEEVPAK